MSSESTTSGLKVIETETMRFSRRDEGFSGHVLVYLQPTTMSKSVSTYS